MLAQRASGPHCGTSHPRLFVYDLPPTYHQCIDLNHLADASGFPRLLQNGSLTQPPLRQTGGYALGSVFLSRALNYSCRTWDAADADLFFVPILSETFICAKWCGEQNCSRAALYSRLEHLPANGGRDHILLSARQGWREDLHPYYNVRFEDAHFGAATRLSAEEGAKYDWPVEPTLPLFRGTPQASYVHVSAAARWDDAPWRSQHSRQHLVATASNLIHNYHGADAFTKQLNTLRLGRNCMDANDTRVCTHLALSPTAVYKKHNDLRMVRQIGGLYWNTTFCPMAVGDACTRKAIIDAVLLGCIPVFFHRCQLLQWPWHIGGWLERATLFYDMERVVGNRSRTPLDLVGELKRVPALTVARMQRTIAEHAHCLHYAVTEPGFVPAAAATRIGDVPGAFEIALQGAWRLSRNASIEASHRPHLCRRVPIDKDSATTNLIPLLTPPPLPPPPLYSPASKRWRLYV